MKKNEKGSSLIYAVIVIMILTVTIAAAMAIAYSYYNRSIVNNSRRQAQLSAKTVITNIVDNIMGQTADYTVLIPDGLNVTENKLTITDFPTSMGSIDQAKMFVKTQTIEGEKIQTLTVSVTATYNQQTKAINADLEKKVTETKWQFLKYYEGEVTININVTNAEKMYVTIDTIRSILGNTNDTMQIRKEKIAEVFKSDQAILDKVRAAIPGFKADWTNVRNDTIRQYLFYGVYDKQWPKFDNSATNSNFKGTGTYYIQFYFPSTAFENIGSNKPYKDVLIYASPNNVDTGSWSNINLVYYEGKWYYNEKKALPIYNLGGATAEAQEKAWNDVFINGWLNTAVPVT